MKINKLLIGLLYGLIGLGLQVQPVSAVIDEQSDFEIQRVPAEAQVNNDVNYFDMAIKPSDQQEMMVRVRNFTDRKITIKSELRNSITQDGGGLGFQASSKDLDDSLKYPLTAFATVAKKDRVFTLNPQETRVVSAMVKMPQERLHGLIYGDWHFLETTTAQNEDSHVSNNYAYSMGVALRGSHYKVYPELKYEGVQPMLFQKHAAMGVDLRNIQPMMIQKVSIKAIITKQGVFSQKRIFNVQNSQIAPNSKIRLPVQWQYDKLKPGKYKIAVEVKGENDWNKLPMTWKFIKDVTVKRDVASEINSKIMRKPVNKWFYISIATGGLLLITGAELLKLLLTGSEG